MYTYCCLIKLPLYILNFIMGLITQRFLKEKIEQERNIKYRRTGRHRKYGIT